MTERVHPWTMCQRVSLHVTQQQKGFRKVSVLKEPKYITSPLLTRKICFFKPPHNSTPKQTTRVYFPHQSHRKTTLKYHPKKAVTPHPHNEIWSSVSLNWSKKHHLTNRAVQCSRSHPIKCIWKQNNKQTDYRSGSEFISGGIYSTTLRLTVIIVVYMTTVVVSRPTRH